jgi:hypothetical protein
MTASYPSARGEQSRAHIDHHDAAAARRLSTETKSSFTTTEFWRTCSCCGSADRTVRSQDHRQPRRLLRADPAWYYVLLLTLGYPGSPGIGEVR